MSSQSALAYAASMNGTRETSPNWGGQYDRITRWIKASGYTFPVPWCQCFANAVAEAGGAPLIRNGYTPDFWNGHFRAQGYEPIPLAQAQAGDFVYFDWQLYRGDPTDHVGVLVSMTATTVTCWEGNTSPTNEGSQNNGDGVYLKTRARSLVRGAVSVPYAGESSDAFRSLGVGDTGRDVRAFQVAVNKRAAGCGRDDRAVVVDGEMGAQTIANGAWAAWILGIGDSQAQISEGDSISRYVQHLVRNIDERNQTQKDRAPHRRQVAGCSGG